MLVMAKRQAFGLVFLVIKINLIERVGSVVAAQERVFLNCKFQKRLI